MINLAQPDTIDERAINKKSLNVYRIQVSLFFSSRSSIDQALVLINVIAVTTSAPIINVFFHY